jgi:hypothetical protein
MKKMYRNFLFFSSTVVFLSIAPLIVLYAMGYRLSSRIVDPLPVGALFIETKPKEATVELDNTVDGDTPLVQSNLTPGTKKITIKKEGYVTWEKNLTIDPASVVELRDIRLFPAEPTTTPFKLNIQTFSLSPHRRYLATVDSRQRLMIDDEEGRPVAGPQALPARPRALLWSADSTALLIQYPQLPAQVFSLTADNEQLRNLPRLRSNTREVVWDPRIPARLLYLTPANQLFAYSLITNTGAKLTDAVDTFAPSARTIVTAHQNGTLAIRSLQGDIQNTLSFVPEKKVAKLLVTPTGKIAALTSGKELYLLTEDSRWAHVADEVESAGWSPDNQFLYVQTKPNALHLYHPGYNFLSWIESEKLHLVIRLSRPITHPQWFAGSRHLIYQIDDQIAISEIDTRDHPVQQTIDSTNLGQANVVVGSEGEVLFYLKAHDATIDLIRTDLIVP